MRAFQAKTPVPHPALACLAAIYLVLCVPALPNEGGVYLGGVWPAHPACPVVVLGLTWWRWRCAHTLSLHCTIPARPRRFSDDFCEHVNDYLDGLTNFQNFPGAVTTAGAGLIRSTVTVVTAALLAAVLV